MKPEKKIGYWPLPDLPRKRKGWDGPYEPPPNWPDDEDGWNRKEDED